MKIVLLFALVAGLCEGAFSSLEVVTPAEADIVIANRTYTVEWTGSSSSRFDIDLYLCDTSYCIEDSCGEFISSLCQYTGEGCPDSDGDYDVILPEPVGGSGGGYTILVSDRNDDLNYDCSREFYLMASGDAPRVGDVDGPSMEVVSPAAFDELSPGETVTVKFVYDNGVGSTADRFNIDLHIEDGEDACGTKVESLCDEPEIGCKDSEGDYDVTIPPETDAGTYTILVARHETGEPYDCSPSFKIVGNGQPPKIATPAPALVPAPSYVDPTRVPSSSDPAPSTVDLLPSTPKPANPVPTTPSPTPDIVELTPAPAAVPSTSEPDTPEPPTSAPTPDTPELSPEPGTPEPPTPAPASNTPQPTAEPTALEITLETPSPTATGGQCTGEAIDCSKWSCRTRGASPACLERGKRCGAGGCSSRTEADWNSSQMTCSGTPDDCDTFVTEEECIYVLCDWIG
eukprot:g14272.t1